MSTLSTKYRSGTKVAHQLFTSNGTWNKPAKFIEGTLIVTGTGGGASGNKNSNTACGGNAGEYICNMYLNVSSISSASVVIGAGGAAVTGTAPLAGNSGSPTTFGALLTLSGGIGSTSLGVQGISVGGARGGRESTTGSTTMMLPQNNNSLYGGNGGYNGEGDYSTTSINAVGLAGGGGGLVLDGTGKSGGSSGGSSPTSGGVGYGAGGGAQPAQNSGAGASGALYLTWQEYI